MKNTKRIAALLLVVLQLFLLCGCNALDELRESQAFHGEGTDILWKGTAYKLLPECEYLRPEIDYDAMMISLTAEDVPVLLSFMLSDDELIPSTDGVILEPMYEGGYYCRADKYEEITTRIQSFTPDKIGYSYEVYEEEDSWEYTEVFYTLTDAQVDVLELVTSTVEPQTMGEGWSLDYDWSVTLEGCSEDMLLRRAEMDIAYTGRSYYLVLYTDTETLAFAVPAGCNDQLDQITSAYQTAWESFWGEEEDFL